MDQLLPFPIGHVVFSPAMVATEGRVYRAALAICAAYWLAGCRPIGRDPAALAALARLPNSHMTVIKLPLFAVLDELLPMLATAYAARADRRTRQQAVAKYASSIAHAHHKPKEPRKGKSFADPKLTARIQPVKAPAFRPDARTNETDRSAAIERDPTKPRRGRPPNPKPTDQQPARPQGLLSHGPPRVRE